jgi:hypothetical protein
MLPPPEIIDLVSDSEDEAPPPVAAARRGQLPDHQRGHFAALEPNNDFLADFFPDPGPRNDPGLPAMGDLIGVPLVIDDFDYLAEDPPLDEGATTDPPEEGDVEQPPIPDAEPDLSQEDCLSRVYDLFPDICPEHATKICNRAGQNSLLSGAALLDQVVEKLLADNTYPKRKKETQNLKRKREESVDHGFEQWERENREPLPYNAAVPIRAILKAEFPTFTHPDITEAITEGKYLFKSYIHLANLRDTDVVVRRGRASATNNDADAIAAKWPEMTEELAAARRKAQANKNMRLMKMATEMAEDRNLERAIAAGEVAECQACFDDLPTNRQIHCHGGVPHYTCFSCIKTYIASEIGDARCNVMCTAGCGAGFEPAQLNRIDDKRLLEKLADLQQEQDIRNAGLEDLEECPFCDYKAIMPPVEEDFEFRCANPECEKVSCRRCKDPTHIPITCEQHAKDKKACSRHTIEEAMTKALLRCCNNCKKQFIKEYGCNKMTCPSCKNLQCYACSETLKGYDHFDQHPGGGARAGGKCPLYDNLEERHEREVEAARETATALVIANNPDVVPEDLEIKLSDAVKKATAQQIRQAGPEGLGGGPAARWGAGLFAGGVGGRAPRFIEDDDEEDFDDFNDDDDADPFGANLPAHLRVQMQAARHQRIVRDRAGVLPALAQGNMVPAGLHARLMRQQGRRRQEEEELRDMGNAVQAGGAAPALRPLDAVQRIQQIEDARQQRIQQIQRIEEARQALRVPPPPRLNPQQHDNNLADERLDLHQRWRPVPNQQLPAFAPGGLDALFHDFEQFPQVLLYPQPAQPQPMAQPPPQAFAHNPDVFRGPIHVDRGFGLARVRARHQQHVEGVGAARADQLPNPPARLPAEYVPRPNAQLNAAGLANVQRNLHHLELLRQQHDERTGNVPVAPPGVQNLPPRRHGPRYFGWE